MHRRQRSFRAVEFLDRGDQALTGRVRRLGNAFRCCLARLRRGAFHPGQAAMKHRETNFVQQVVDVVPNVDNDRLHADSKQAFDRGGADLRDIDGRAVLQEFELSRDLVFVRINRHGDRRVRVQFRPRQSPVLVLALEFGLDKFASPHTAGGL